MLEAGLTSAARAGKRWKGRLHTIHGQLCEGIDLRSWGTLGRCCEANCNKTRIFGSSHTESHLHTCAGWDGRFSHGFGVLYEVRGHAGWAIMMGITVSEAVTIEAVHSNRGRIPPYTHTMRISHRQHGYALWRCSADTCHPASRSGYLPSRCPLLSP
jgi:hypothetical protein